MNRYLLGFDIGGTFTDLVFIDAGSGRMWVHKVPTTPADPSRGAMEGIRSILGQSGLPAGDVDVVIHGTTLVTNALIEGLGARTALLTTSGFRDILEMGREQRYDIYDLFLRFPDPLVPRRWRRGIVERVDRFGQVVTPLDREQVRREVATLVEQGVDSIAVCFLHAYVNPEHERAVAAIITQEHPDISVSLSHEVVAEIREFERVATTCANAYVRPLVKRYVAALASALAGERFTSDFYLMQSSGGTASPEAAQDLPIHLLESGPAAGALAAARMGHLLDRDHLLSFDMGGTTAKASLITGGAPLVTAAQEVARVHRFKRGSGIPVKAPAIDMIEIGAGGGSIARVSSLGLLKVGPDSAGADPGPACYGKGGIEPTVTDADLALGYLNPDYFLGGRIRLDVEAAERAIRHVADPLGLSATEAAWGIHSIVNENMGAAARVHVIERGRDPRRYTLVAFGGAGPLHAAAVARLLGSAEIVLPFAAGAMSALGLLLAPLSFDFARSYPIVLEQIDFGALNVLFEEMEARGTARLVEAGIDAGRVRVTRSADMRLVGQFHEINVPVPASPLGPEHVVGLQRAFVAEYRRLHSHMYEGVPIMALTWRVRVEGPLPEVNLRRAARSTYGVGGARAEARKGNRRAFFPVEGFVEIPVYDRYLLQPGFQAEGPAVIEERESTALIYPGDRFQVDPYLNLVVRLDATITRPGQVGAPP